MPAEHESWVNKMSQSSFIEDLKVVLIPAKQCGVEKIRSQMGEDERAALDDAFEKIRTKNVSYKAVQTSGYTYKWLYEVLNKHGHIVSFRVVEKHTRKMCACNVN